MILSFWVSAYFQVLYQFEGGHMMSQVVLLCSTSLIALRTSLWHIVQASVFASLEQWKVSPGLWCHYEISNWYDVRCMMHEICFILYMIHVFFLYSLYLYHISPNTNWCIYYTQISDSVNQHHIGFPTQWISPASRRDFKNGGNFRPPYPPYPTKWLCSFWGCSMDQKKQPTDPPFWSCDMLPLEPTRGSCVFLRNHLHRLIC